ncbi:uncharacterized protein F5147DRAFT_657741 [Suillus discolor]|uniref:Fungal-type protein kinase domain-containing protein n=1 Tax=Suillus discolor TaxID=1912936 RepID=A0A9P7JN91_9AGAM|nr:uncharacterized protein F5147DRAFT_657741 [Suillus discolor]KAG2092117.1 hypothetical protein F5147DRAFT_657741 [Suillus discolor]
MTETMLPQPVSTTSYHRRLFGSVSTTNALPEPQDKSAMDKLLEQELIGQVLWEEKSLPQDAESIMDALILDTNFTPTSLSKIHYSVSGPGEKKVQGVPVFHPASRGMGGVWQLDKRNVWPRLLVNSRQKTQRGQKTQPHAQMSKAVVVTDTEVDSDSSFTSPETNKSFGAKGYDDKNPNKKRQRASATSEGKWTLLFNAVQAAMHIMYAKIFPNPSAAFPFCPMDITSGLPKRIWSSQFSNSAVPDDTNAQKPDIILVDYNLRSLPLRWCNIITCFELTESSLSSTSKLYWGSATKGYLIMREQPWRRFVLIFSIAHNELRLHYFNRSGLIISRPTSIVAKPVRLLEVLNTLTLAHTNTLGYDPTMHMCDPACKGTHLDLRENTIGWIEGPDEARLSIINVLWRSQGFFSRGTICYRIQTSSGVEYALKDCWVAKDKRYHEVTVLRMVEGIPNVVRLVADWDVLYDGELDCTHRIRASHGMHTLGFIRRFHRRLLLTPCGEPLLSYSSKSKLLRSFYDFVRGYYIDFDHAGITQGSKNIRSQGTGTKPYMLIRLLREDVDNQKKEVMIEHTASDDLESLFYIFVEFATTFDGPCGVTRDQNRRPLWVEHYEVMGSTSWVSKQGYVLSPLVDRSLMTKTTPFFGPFSQIIQEWRHLILAAASETNDSSPGVTHAALATLLGKWITQLPPDLPEEIPVPMASSSRLAHPPPDTQSSAGPRRSARIQQRS